jgi:protocatechuate 3,4-dioxygenase beta subunit
MRLQGLVLAAVVILTGRVLDRTTGQPLSGVSITAPGASATSDGAGRYRLRGLHPGNVTLTLESPDVPAQHLTVRLGAGTTQRDLRACSTTLDYACGVPAAPPGGGPA